MADMAGGEVSILHMFPTFTVPQLVFGPKATISSIPRHMEQSYSICIHLETPLAKDRLSRTKRDCQERSAHKFTMSHANSKLV